MEEIEKMSEASDINYDVYNALNLYSEKLGQSYIDNGFNPFEEGFVLTEDYVTTALENAKEQQTVPSPAFLENGDENALKAFETSNSNVQNLIEQIENALNSGGLSLSQEEKLKKALMQLKMFLELLRIDILEFKKLINKLKAYEQLLSINWFLREELEESFTQNFKPDKIIDKIKNSSVSTTNENKLLQEQAKQIIERNILAQEENLRKEQARQEQLKKALVQEENKRQTADKPESSKADDSLER